MGHPSTTSGVADQRPDAISGHVGIFSWACSSSLISSGMQRAAPAYQALGRPHVRPAQNGRTLPMIAQPLTDITFSPADRAEVASMVDDWYSRALLLLKQAEKLRMAADLPLPASGAQLYAALIPRQTVVSR